VGDETEGVRVIGVDPSSAANAPVRDGLVAGDFPAADDREGVLLGQPLADRLSLHVGDKVTLLINTSNGDVDQQAFTIRGLYSTRTPTYDDRTVFLPLAKAQAITRAEDHASTILVILHDREQAEAVAAALQGPGLQTITWQKANELLIQTEQFARAYMVVLYLIVLGITATVIVNTLVMAVFERTREIGILSAIGMRQWRIMAMFFAESGLLGVGGIALGLVIGGLLVAYATNQGFYIGNMGVTGMMLGERIYAYLTVQDTLTLTVVAFIVTLLAALYPAWLAARLEPVEALRAGQ
jgi:ABC-type lipoprotein release transport system permease subunit